MTKLFCLSGSLRSASSSRAVLDMICRKLEGRAEATRFDIGSLPHYNPDFDPLPETVVALKAAIDEADGLIIVTPEYNYSVPGVLKNAIDWASRPGYASVLKHKPVLVVSTSGGALGGVRAQAHLKNILSAVLAKPFPWQEIVVPHANQKVKDGIFSDEAVETFLSEALNAFLESLEDNRR